jgi:hypothetical protein
VAVYLVRFGRYSAPGTFRKSGKPSIVTSMWHKVADGVYWVEGPDGLPVGLATTLDGGTPLTIAEGWWAGAQKLIHDLASSDTVRDMLRRQVLGEGERPED